MTEKNKQLLDYIIKGYSVEEIKTAMNLTSKQFLLRVRQLARDGYSFHRSFDIDGTCVYQLNKSLVQEENFTINSEKNINEFLIISDTHFGEKRENWNYINKIYNYAKKNNIHTIFHLGDFFHGVYTTKGNSFSPSELNQNTLDKQLHQVLKKYPFDPSILNYILGGNHDFYSYHFEGQNILSVLENSRTDFVLLGYGNTTISVRNVNFNLIHRLVLVDHLHSDINQNVCFYGHSHRSRLKLHSNNRLIIVPSLSDVQVGSETSFPGAYHIILNTTFDDSCARIIIKHIMFFPEAKVVNIIELPDVNYNSKKYSKKK